MKIQWKLPTLTSLVEPFAEVVEALELKPRSIVLEYGARSGKSTLHIARKLDTLAGDGIVFVADRKVEPLKRLDDRAVKHDLDHRIRFLRLKKQENRKVPMKTDAVDRVLVLDGDIQFQKGAAVIKELERVLKSGGLLVTGSTDQTARHPLPPEEAARQAAESLGAVGFQIIRLMRPTDSAWVISASK